MENLSNGDFYEEYNRSFIALYSYVEYQFFIVASKKASTVWSTQLLRVLKLPQLQIHQHQLRTASVTSSYQHRRTWSPSPRASGSPSTIMNNHKHLQGIMNRIGFKHSLRVAGIAVSKGVNKVIATRSCLDLRRLQQRLRRLQPYTAWTWIQRLAAST